MGEHSSPNMAKHRAYVLGTRDDGAGLNSPST
jgi:hypothetical protein